MTFALLAVAALLLPWIAGYLAIGIVTGPLLLGVLRRRYGVQIQPLRDVPVAISGWIAVLGWIAFMEARQV
jgi:uncharacterized membrane protein YhaH (DUF805 family)